MTGPVAHPDGGLRLSSLNVRQLTQLNQLLGRQIDELRAKREYLNLLIAKRLANGESEASLAAEAPVDAPAEVVDAVAPGAVIQAQGGVA